ncbi:ABC transporter permease [Azorhizobium doebereinerae]|uniref:ABC transporter permease n=1 Tax=Azorhizobium doebereinerae TaxID=281091 RepID=UPI0018DE8B3F|nr:ABC transporter permease [Azorhizobium doebereinerae]
MRYKASFESPAWFAVWYRNYLTWRRGALLHFIGTVADPIVALLGLGIGIGPIVGLVDGQPYISFLAGGLIVTGAMAATNGEMFYGAFTRFYIDQTWSAMLYTRLSVADVLFGEVCWGATRGCAIGVIVYIVSLCFGYVSWHCLFMIVPILIVVCLTFSCISALVVSFAKGYELFLICQSVFFVPLVFTSGAIFPASQMPRAIRWWASMLPLYPSVELMRGALNGAYVPNFMSDVVILASYAVIAFGLALAVLKRRIVS